MTRGGERKKNHAAEDKVAAFKNKEHPNSCTTDTLLRNAERGKKRRPYEGREGKLKFE